MTGFLVSLQLLISVTGVHSQAGILACGNKDFLTNFVTQTLNFNRERLRAADPIRLGSSYNLGFVRFSNSRLYSSYTAFIRDKIIVHCNQTTMYLIIPIGVKNTTITFDYSSPFDMIRGKLHALMSVFGGDVHLTAPISRLRNPEIRQKVLKIELWATKDLVLYFSDYVYRFVGFTFNLLHRTLQRSIDIIMERLVYHVISEYNEAYPFPL